MLKIFDVTHKRFHIAKHLLIAILLIGNQPLMAQSVCNTFNIPIDGNSFITSPMSDIVAGKNRNFTTDNPCTVIRRGGIYMNMDTVSVASTYFYIKEPCSPKLTLNVWGSGMLLVTCGKQQFKVAVDCSKWVDVKVGKLNITSDGYVKVDFRLLSTQTAGKIAIGRLTLEGVTMMPLFIRSDFDSHFGLRGPSVHLQYEFPAKTKAEWFYNEVTVPKEGEVMGSYYCAQGFGGGYFGFQYNSPTERRVLFSIWSPFDTSDPSTIPPEDRVTLLKKGEQTHIGDFGNEGAGAQSFLVYPWKAGNTYRFLMHIRPSENNCTDYTAYFYAPEEGKWILVASFRRPRTNLYVEGAYSFVENFSPNMGFITRKSYFGNAWVRSSEGKWLPVNSANFTNDDTGRRGVRVDYLGGTEGGRFFLKMGGFFGNGSNAERHLVIDTPTQAPDVEVEQLP